MVRSRLFRAPVSDFQVVRAACLGANTSRDTSSRLEPALLRVMTWRLHPQLKICAVCGVPCCTRGSLRVATPCALGRCLAPVADFQVCFVVCFVAPSCRTRGHRMLPTPRALGDGLCAYGLIAVFVRTGSLRVFRAPAHIKNVDAPRAGSRWVAPAATIAAPSAVLRFCP